MWSLMAAPLIMSADLRTIKPEFRSILLNRDAIAINQDALGIQGIRLYKEDDISIWIKPILPIIHDRYPSYGLGIVSERTDGYPIKLDVSLIELGMDVNPIGYKVTVRLIPSSSSYGKANEIVAFFF